MPDEHDGIIIITTRNIKSIAAQLVTIASYVASPFLILSHSTSLYLCGVCACVCLNALQLPEMEGCLCVT